MEHAHDTAEEPPRWAKGILGKINDVSPFVGNCETLLNLGCGSAKPPLSKRPRYLVGVDRYQPAIRVGRQNRTHDDFVVADLRHLPFQEKCVDGVLALDAIEHLAKDDGERLLHAMERVARKRVLLITPNGFASKEDLENGNPWQAHRSGWTTGDFARRGYVVRGRRGLQSLRGEHATIRWRPRVFWGLMSYLSQVIVRTKPELSYHLLAYKILRE